jgi:hypothetical protein
VPPENAILKIMTVLFMVSMYIFKLSLKHLEKMVGFWESVYTTGDFCTGKQHLKSSRICKTGHSFIQGRAACYRNYGNDSESSNSTMPDCKKITPLAVLAMILA